MINHYKNVEVTSASNDVEINESGELAVLYTIEYISREGNNGVINVWKDAIPFLKRKNRLKILKMIQDGGY